MAKKVCSSCGKSKRITEFRKYPGRSIDGYRSICKDCQREYDREWRRKRREACKND